jgi:hypothetical protein
VLFTREREREYKRDERKRHFGRGRGGSGDVPERRRIRIVGRKETRR